LLRNIIGLFVALSKKSPTCENAWLDAGTATFYFSPIRAMPGVMILAVLSVVGRLTGAKTPYTEALNIIAAKKASKRKCIWMQDVVSKKVYRNQGSMKMAMMIADINSTLQRLITSRWLPVS
jgi:hypothetical protein